MSYHYSYGHEDGTEDEGDDFASGSGWVTWVEFVLEDTDGLEECDQLAGAGWAMIEPLRAELPKLREQQSDPDLQHITDRLIQAVKEAPAGATVLMIGDGVEGDDEDEDEEDDE